MTMLLGTRRSLFGGRKATYADKVLSYNPIIYFPMNETAGLTAVNLGTLGTAANGTYTGVTLNNAVGPDGTNGAPFFDGANDYLDFFSAAFDAAFSGATGTAMVWFRVANAGVWTDGSTRLQMSIFDDALNYYDLRKLNANNQAQVVGNAGGGVGTFLNAAANETTWVHYAVTWSDGANADELIGYYAGVAMGAASAALNAWTGGGLNATRVVFGAQTTGPAGPWHGWLAHGAIWGSVLTPAQILDLATPTG